MIISAILAMDENRVIGKDNQLPWHLPADLQHFKQITWGKPIIMGRKTFQSIGKALPGRKNIVITRDLDFRAENCTVVHSLEDVFNDCKDASEVMIIGGAELIKQTLPQIQKLYLTLIHHQFEGNIYFPELNEKEWKEIDRVDHQPDEKNKYAYTFLTLSRL